MLWITLQQRSWYVLEPSYSINNHNSIYPITHIITNCANSLLQVNISKVQDDEVGDGTTSVCVLAAELLREGERLVGKKIHPQTIIAGYRIASAAAYEALEASAADNR